MPIIVILNLNINKKYHKFDHPSQTIKHYHSIRYIITPKERKPLQNSKIIEQKEIPHLATAWRVEIKQQIGGPSKDHIDEIIRRASSNCEDIENTQEKAFTYLQGIEWMELACQRKSKQDIFFNTLISLKISKFLSKFYILN